MPKAFLLGVLTMLAGCAGQPAQPPVASVAAALDTGAVAAASPLLAAATQPAAQLDVTDFTSTTVCRKVVPTGTRMVRGEVCTSNDNLTFAQKDYAEKRLQRDIDDVNRMQTERIRRYEEQMNPFFRPLQR